MNTSSHTPKQYTQTFILKMLGDTDPPPTFDPSLILEEWLVTVNDLYSHRLHSKQQAKEYWDHFCTHHPSAKDFLKRKLWHVSELQDMPSPEWIVEGEVLDKSINVIYGPSNAGKSLVAWDYAERISKTHTVVYVAGEAPYQYQSRHQAWKAHHGGEEGSLYVWDQPVNLVGNDNSLDEFMDEIETLNPTLIIFDTLATAMEGANENDTSDMVSLANTANMLIRELDTAIVLIHHSGKEVGRGERGSTALRGSAETMIEVTQDANRIVRVKCTKQRNAQPFETKYLKFVEVAGTDSVVLLPASKVMDTKLSAKQREVMTVLHNEGGTLGLGIKEVSTLGEIKYNTVKDVLKILDKRGLVRKHHSTKKWMLSEAGKKAFAEHDSGHKGSGREDLEVNPVHPSDSHNSPKNHTRFTPIPYPIENNTTTEVHNGSEE